MNKFFKKLINNKAGFTLLETMVAIMLFVIALSALLALVRDSVTSATYNKNEIVATYLAQEGIDYIRNMRDEIVQINAGSSPTPWGDFVTYVKTTGGCDPNGPGCELNVYDPTNKLKLFTIGEVVISGKTFKRKITIQTPSNDALMVRVDVSWKNGTTSRTKTLTTSLYNWAL